MSLSWESPIGEVFVSACERNDLNTVRTLLTIGADVNWKRDSNGMSGLFFAALKNYGELLELLLAQTGVNVNIKNNSNVTPLMTACCEGHENIVRRLCQVPGIELNCRDVDGWTALHRAEGCVEKQTRVCFSVERSGWC